MPEEQEGTPTSTETEETTEEVVEETTEEPEQQEGETIEEYKARLQKAEELAQNYKIRAEKAEKAAKSAKQTGDTQKDLADSDIIFLAKTDIHDDDISDVVRWAKNDKISVKEAYQAYKPILDNRSQERKTAEVTNTQGGARGAKKTDGNELLRKAERTGEVPDSDEGMAQLAQARFMAGRKK